MSKPELIPEDASRMECLVLIETLRRMKEVILSGTPSGAVIDQAIEETIAKATS